MTSHQLQSLRQPATIGFVHADSVRPDRMLRRANAPKNVNERQCSDAAVTRWARMENRMSTRFCTWIAPLKSDSGVMPKSV